MGNEQYRKTYEAAASELESLLLNQEKIEQRILALRKTMNALSTLCELEGIDMSDIDVKYARLMRLVQGSLSADILRIVSAANEALTTSDIRNELNKLGGSLAEHSNPLATINAVASRLTESGQIKEVIKDDRKAWRSLTVAESFAAPPQRRKFGAVNSLANILADGKDFAIAVPALTPAELDDAYSPRKKK